jgi:hypothetical protein
MPVTATTGSSFGPHAAIAPMTATAASITIIFDTNALISCLIVSIFPKIQPFPDSGKSPRLPNLHVSSIFVQIPGKYIRF